MRSLLTWRAWCTTTPWPDGHALTLLLLRLWLAQEFGMAGYTKLAGGLQPPEWFAGLQFPFPHHLLSPQFNWVMAGGLELLAALVLLVGLGTRAVALVLLYVTYVAVYSVHFDLGWAGWNQIETEAGNGFKVPLMIALMLATVLAQGAGRWSLDAWWSRSPRQRGTVAACTNP